MKWIWIVLFCFAVLAILMEVANLALHWISKNLPPDDPDTL